MDQTGDVLIYLQRLSSPAKPCLFPSFLDLSVVLCQVVMPIVSMQSETPNAI
jgi:hypothetical protein